MISTDLLEGVAIGMGLYALVDNVFWPWIAHRWTLHSRRVHVRPR